MGPSTTHIEAFITHFRAQNEFAHNPQMWFDEYFSPLFFFPCPFPVANYWCHPCASNSRISFNFNISYPPPQCRNKSLYRSIEFGPVKMNTIVFFPSYDASSNLRLHTSKTTPVTKLSTLQKTAPFPVSSEYDIPLTTSWQSFFQPLNIITCTSMLPSNKIVSS